VRTFGFGGFVIGFADKFAIFHQIKFVARVQLTATENALKAFQMVDVMLRSSHNLRRSDSLIATRTFGTESP
jgi:hypothetical protein